MISSLRLWEEAVLKLSSGMFALRSHAGVSMFKKQGDQGKPPFCWSQEAGTGTRSGFNLTWFGGKRGWEGKLVSAKVRKWRENSRQRLSMLIRIGFRVRGRQKGKGN